MMFGLGDTASGTGTGTGSTSSTTPPATTIPGFTDGLKLWGTPSTAVTVLTTAAQNPGVSFASTILPFTLGVLAVPVGLIAVVMSMNSKRGM